MIYSRLPPHCHVRAQERVDSVTMACEPDAVRHTVHKNLFNSIASLLVRDKVKEQVEGFTTAFSVDLLVFTPDEFYQIVTEEAARLGMLSRRNVALRESMTIADGVKPCLP